MEATVRPAAASRGPVDAQRPVPPDASAGSIRFVHETPAQRVLFGSGQARTNLAAETTRLGARRPMLITAPGRRDTAERITAGLPVAAWYDRATQHVPLTVADQARERAAESHADLLVCIGGGSAIGVGKAVALTSGLPIVAVPTTYAGSEATSVWGITRGQRKETGVDPVVLPVSIVYDAELTLGLPRELSVVSGLNALAHCVDSLWAPRADPINRVLALEGAGELSRALRVIAVDPQDLRSRETAQYACHLAAVAFASAGSGLHHKLCHVLGGMIDLPHAATHAVVLPYVLAFNAAWAPDAVAGIAHALGSRDAVDGLQGLLAAVDAPRSLRDLGMPESSLAEAVEVALPLIPPSNPRPVDSRALTTLLRAAWAGTSVAESRPC